MLNLAVIDRSNPINIEYHISDGSLYSDPKQVKINFEADGEDKEGGLLDINPTDYSGFEIAIFNGYLQGVANDNPEFPKKIDLSPNFPPIGNQKTQSSCVGWAVAYSLKTYQERLDQGWTLNTNEHIFSPAFVYNQINGGFDQGSYIHEALQLLVDVGAATWSYMPYFEYDYLSQPNFLALLQASEFKAKRWARVSDRISIQAALANRLPVVAGVMLDDSFNFLNQANPSYQPTSEYIGGHAITIVGYDDSKFGGSFKVMNSWGSDWGENGYFWLPYDVAQKTITQAYILEDIVSEDTVSIIDTYVNNSPQANLTINSWSIEYDSVPRGYGTMQFEIGNTGLADAPMGTSVCLMASVDSKASSDDTFIVCDSIPFDLEPNYIAYRDDNNEIPFQFPDQLKPGTYYLYLWVDSENYVSEQDEKDNWSFGNSLLILTDVLPDLIVNSWYVTWDYQGQGSLQYEVLNQGAGTIYNTNWDINLVLSQDLILNDSTDYFLLFSEKANFTMEYGDIIYRDAFSQAYFNINYDIFGYHIPDGTYYMAMWVDNLNQVNESNEINNYSFDWGEIKYGNSRNTRDNLSSVSRNEAYNSRNLGRIDPQRTAIVEVKNSQARIVRQPSRSANANELTEYVFSKKIESENSLYFPYEKRIKIID